MKKVSKLGDGIREAVFGANDGVVSTFGILSGLVGAGSSSRLIALVGVIQLFAAGLSMGLGAYISTKSQNEVFSSVEDDEEHEIEQHPAREKGYVKNALKTRGLSGKVLDQATDSVTKDKKNWLHFLIQERLGIAETSYPHPVFAGLIMFIAFVLAGFFAVLPFFFAIPQRALLISATASLLILFVVGASKTKFTKRDPWLSGLENLMIGAATGVIAFLVGAYVEGLL